MSTITKKNTIIFGGAFNPPTLAHEQMLQECIRTATEKDADIWILPSGNRSDKTINVSITLRLQYIDAMMSDVKHRGVKIEIIDYELRAEKLTNTYDTIQYLNSNHKDRNFIWVFGADSVNTMLHWPGGDWILQNTRMIIFNRLGSAIIHYAEDSIVCDKDIPGISSTELRRRLEENIDYRDMVGQEVYSLLKNQLVL